MKTTTQLSSIDIKCFETTYVGCLALFLYPLLIRKLHNNQMEEAVGYLNYKSKYHKTGCMANKKYTIGADNLF